MHIIIFIFLFCLISILKASHIHKKKQKLKSSNNNDNNKNKANIPNIFSGMLDTSFIFKNHIHLKISDIPDFYSNDAWCIVEVDVVTNKGTVHGYPLFFKNDKHTICDEKVTHTIDIATHYNNRFDINIVTAIDEQMSELLKRIKNHEIEKIHIKNLIPSTKGHNNNKAYVIKQNQDNKDIYYISKEDGEKHLEDIKYMKAGLYSIPEDTSCYNYQKNEKWCGMIKLVTEYCGVSVQTADHLTIKPNNNKFKNYIYCEESSNEICKLGKKVNRNIDKSNLKNDIDVHSRSLTIKILECPDMIIETRHAGIYNHIRIVNKKTIDSISKFFMVDHYIGKFGKKYHNQISSGPVGKRQRSISITNLKKHDRYVKAMNKEYLIKQCDNTHIINNR